MSRKPDKSNDTPSRSVGVELPGKLVANEKIFMKESLLSTPSRVGKTPFPGRVMEEKSRAQVEEKPVPTPVTPPEAKGKPLEKSRHVPVEEPVEEPVKEPEQTGPPQRDQNMDAVIRRGPVSLKRLARRKVPLLPTGGVFLVLVLVVSWILSGWNYRRGEAHGLQLAEDAATKSKVELAPEVAKELNEALFQLRKGEVADALKRLQKLETLPQGVASLSYLVALAAMQNGDITLAERKVSESISKREKISDALALQSVLESQKAADPSMTSMGDPKMRSEALLRQATIADGANPYPHFELATLLRYQGKTEEAKAEIRAAQARLNPIDSHLVMEVTLAFMEIEETPVGELPTDVPAGDNVVRLFPAAFSAMRRGDFDQAASLLQRCQQALSVDAFDYLVNDPALRRYLGRPELRPFFGG